MARRHRTRGEDTFNGFAVTDDLRPRGVLSLPALRLRLEQTALAGHMKGKCLTPRRRVRGQPLQVLRPERPSSLVLEVEDGYGSAGLGAQAHPQRDQEFVRVEPADRRDDHVVPRILDGEVHVAHEAEAQAEVVLAPVPVHGQ
jgi:hypothetical protein